MKYVVGLGEALWDMLPAGKQLGGAPANFAYHAAQLGCRSCAVSAVGNDALGEEILKQLAERKLEVRCPKVKEPTGTVAVTLDAAGIPSYEIKEGVAWDHIPFTPELEALAKATQAVCFGSLAQRSSVSRHTIHAFLEAMPQESCKVFDINLRQHYYNREIIESSLRQSNILKINDEELDVLRDLLGYAVNGITELCQQILEDFRLEVVILTCGTAGSYLFTPQTTSYLPTPKVAVADTVGAGDSFTAAFVAAYLAHKSIADCHRLAVAVSAYVCTQAGAMPVLPDSMKNELLP